MAVVTFEGITFDGTGGDAGGGWHLARLTGWYDAAPSRVELRDRPQADGSFGVSRYFRGSRVVSVEGSYSGSSIEDAYAARDQLSALQASGVPSLFVVEDPLGSRTAEAVLAKAPTADDGLFSPFFQFAFDVVAMNPKRYGPAVVTTTGLPSSLDGIDYPIGYVIDYGVPGDSGRLTVSNPGRADTEPMLEVTGGLGGGFELTDVFTGRVLRYVEAVPLGSTVYLNPRTGIVYIDAPTNDKSRALVRREWFALPAGETHEIQFNAIGSVSGTPTLTARTSPAY
jgi:hypothetical protein